MAKKVKDGKNGYSKTDLWIAPSHSLKGPARRIGWELPRNVQSESNRFLKLADIALGVKNSVAPKKKYAA
jgi:hypothetical protein